MRCLAMATPRTLLAGALLALSAGSLGAQCADGTPPPCRASRADPPLDDKTWIVLPFSNLSRANDLEWMRDASVNLLYLDLSRFSDIRVVDDERVATLMRSSTSARTPAGPSLDEAYAIARREGAGRLVLGDLLKSGNATVVVAKVYDVRRRVRLRSVRRDAASTDSVFAAFSRLSGEILDVRGAGGTPPTDVGTASLAAYQAYLDGVRALNRIDLVEARAQLERSLALDSAFALAHYKLSIVGQWELANSPGILAHAEAAARLSERLPERERQLIAAQRHLAAGDVVRACAAYHRLVQSDSSDAEAQFGVGDCEYRDDAVFPASADSTRWQFRGSYNTALRAYSRVLELDPANHLAFQRILTVLASGIRLGCRALELPTRCTLQRVGFVAAVDRDADSLVIAPVQARGGAGAMTARMTEARRSGSRRRNLEEALRIARQWRAAGPLEPSARIQIAYVLQSLGRFDEADVELRTLGSTLQLVDVATLLGVQAFSALRRHDGPRYVALVDSLHALRRGGRVQIERLRLAALSAVAGQLALADSMSGVMQDLPPFVRGYAREAARVGLGVPRDSAVAVEAGVAGLMALAGADANTAGAMLAATLRFGLLLPRRQWPPFLDRSTDPRLAAAAAMSRGDTVALRRVAARLDSAGIDAADAGDPVLAIDARLALGDSTTALALARTIDSSGVLVEWNAVAESLIPIVAMVPRVLLRRGDLAAALGHRAEAHEAYGRWLALWSKADPEFAPTVARVRAAYEGLRP